MEITLAEALKKFFIRDRLIVLLILVLSFGVYPLVERYYFDYKDNDYLLIRIDRNTFEATYQEINQNPVIYLDRLQNITSRKKNDRDNNLNNIICKGFIGARKYEVDCYFFNKLTKSNRAEEVKKYINYIKEDYKNYQLKTIKPHLIKLKEQLRFKYDEEIKLYAEINNDPRHSDVQKAILNFRKEIVLLENLYSNIKNNNSKSLIISHRILNIQKDTLYNSILILIMLCFINFSRVILLN